MVGKLRHFRAIHEAGHAVIARKVGQSIASVSAVARNSAAVTASSAHQSKNVDSSDGVAAYRADAIVALAGSCANRLDAPSLAAFTIPDPLATNDEDFVRARSCVYRMICIEDSLPYNSESGEVSMGPAVVEKLRHRFGETLAETEALVERHWKAIARVAKHLERHETIAQPELDDLIRRAERT